MASSPEIRQSHGSAFRYSNLTELWQRVGPLWEKSQNSWWQQTLPSVIVVPDATTANTLKQLLLSGSHANSPRGHIGLKFFFPSQVRDTLVKARQLLETPVDLSTCALLLSSLAMKSESAPPAALGAPETVLAAWQSLAGASVAWPDDEFHDLLRGLEEELHLRDSIAPWEVDDLLLQRSLVHPEPVFHQLWIIGFDGASWPLWKLLTATAQASEEAYVCIPEPRAISEKADLLWLGTWEKLLGESEAVDSKTEPDRGFSPHATALEKHSSLDVRSPVSHVTYLAAASLQEEADVATHAVLLSLSQNPEATIILGLPADGVLAREVALRLDRLEIPHRDSFGIRLAPPRDTAAWDAWLAWQTQPDARRLETFLRLAEPHHFQIPASHDHRRVLHHFSEAVVQDAPLLILPWLKEHSTPSARQLREWLENHPPLPEISTLGGFLRTLHSQLTDMQWLDRAAILQELKLSFSALDFIECSREIFLRWLKNKLRHSGRSTPESGSHSFARINLVRHAEIASDECSHLILAGMNQGVFPSEIPSNPFLSRQTVEKANRQAVLPGDIVRPGSAYLLSHHELRSFQFKIFVRAVEQTQAALFIIWSTLNEVDHGSPMISSEFVSRLFLAEYSHLPTPEDMRTATENAHRLAHSPLPPLEKINASIRRVEQAQRDRENGSQPFGSYSFSSPHSANEARPLSCTDLERMVTNPAPVWIKHFLGARPSEELASNEDRAAIIIGNQVHQLLQAVINPHKSRDPVPFPDATTSTERFVDAVKQQQQTLEKLCSDSGLPLPPQALALHQKAVLLAEGILENLVEYAAGQNACSELRIPEGVEIDLGEGHILRIIGKTDLLLGAVKTTDGQLTGNVSIIDFKSRSQKPEIKYKQGKGIQIELYAKAWESLGCTITESKLLSAAGFSSKPKPETREYLETLLHRLAKMQASGCFGQLPADTESEFSYETRLPLATLPIDDIVLFQKAKNTWGTL